MKIDVTEEYIRKGIPEKPESCPISLAVKESGKFDWVSTGTRTLSYHDPVLMETVCRYLSPELEQFVTAYDDGEDVGPISFDLEKLECV